MLRDEVSRHNYYLQLKANVVDRDQPKECNDQSMLFLGGLALQADLGDVPINTTGRNSSKKLLPDEQSCLAGSQLPSSSSSSASQPPPTSSTIASRIPMADYFRTEDYIPNPMRSTWGSTAIQSCHREYRGMSSADAETRYIREACNLGDSINAHVFRMRPSKSDSRSGTTLLIIYAKGIKVLSEESGQDTTTFLWPSITKLSFERKKFEIRSEGDRVTLYSLSDEKNKMLLSLCRDTHQFSMKIAPRLMEAIKREEEESSTLHTEYMYSRSMNHLPYHHHGKTKNDQRVSVISSTSSNTTSGIISDRVHSEDELEIMINSPPVAPSIAAPSTESLALAHLLDRPSISRQTSSAGDHQQDDPMEREITGEEMRKNDGNSSSMHNMGSQSSSTCSTVVVATITQSVTTANSSASSSSSTAATTTITQSTDSGSGRRQLSTSSSLELGYSHTAQNSTLSELNSHAIIGGEEDEEDQGLSGVYTLAHHAAPPTETSGVYTMNSSEMTGQSSEMAESVSESHESSHYGCFQPMEMMSSRSEQDADIVEELTRDSVDGKFLPRLADVHRVDGEDTFRLRSNSIISAAGSFRGDGSDPADKKHVLLSAEELTDLIVGRGTYPNRKTVSDNLDCDCDYVTLPLPLEGDSYIQGHQDTAPTEDAFDEDGVALNSSSQAPPPAPPKRIDSVNSVMRLAAATVEVKPSPPTLPPPYNARHETTGLCGPPVKMPVPQAPTQSPTFNSVHHLQPPVLDEGPVLPLRDPPPYPQQPQSIRYPCAIASAAATAHLPSSVSVPMVSPAPPSSVSSSTAASLPEEATARFIKTRPNINILKAHTSVVGEKPSFAAPTLAPQQHPPLPYQQHQQQQQHPAISVSSPQPPAVSQLQAIPSTIGIPLMPYKIHTAHKSMSAYLDTKSAPRTCVLLPVIKPRQYLPPPPPTLPRQPPPPPPSANHQMASVYTSQLARSQIELYQQQLYSDVDYVIYPIQDPSVSQQEYLDAKQGSILAAMAAHNSGAVSHPPPYLAAAYHHQYPASKTHALYRSTPFLPIQMPLSARYASTQNLSDTYVQLPGTYSPMYSPSMASLCSSYTCGREPPPPLPPIRPHSMMGSSNFARSRSDDNILNSIETMPRAKRLPPPPPVHKVTKSATYEVKRINKPPIPTPVEETVEPPPVPAKMFQVLTNGNAGGALRVTPGQVTSPVSTPGLASASPQQLPTQSVDIQLIRERSKNLDLPLIAALCNDRSLLKQTKAFVMPKHPQKGGGGGPVGAGVTVPMTTPVAPTGGVGEVIHQNGKGMQLSGQNMVNGNNNRNNKYPVSGLSTLKLAKPKKTTVSHRHPQDKLPPLPGQTNGGVTEVIKTTNNYVMDPIKHKSYNSQPGA